MFSNQTNSLVVTSRSQALKESELDIPTFGINDASSLEESIQVDSDDPFDPRRIEDESGINLKGSGVNL